MGVHQENSKGAKVGNIPVERGETLLNREKSCRAYSQYCATDCRFPNESLGRSILGLPHKGHFSLLGMQVGREMLGDETGKNTKNCD